MENLLGRAGAIRPLGYLGFLSLQMHATVVLTDSGGVQKEMTTLGVSCPTFRENTERPVTIGWGANRLTGKDPAPILPEIERALRDLPSPKEGPPMWDGRAGERITTVLDRLF